MKDKTKGVLLILLSTLFFALMAAAVKSSGNLPVAEKIFFRNLLGLIVASYIIIKQREKFLGNNKKLLFLRSVFGLLGVAFYFYALGKLPLADAVMLNQTSPFFVMLLSAVFLKEKIRKPQVIALILGLSGVAFIIKPEFNISLLPYFVAILSGFFAASAYTVIRHLRLSDSSETIVFYFTFISTVSMIPVMAFGQFVLPTLPQFLDLIGIGVFATAAQFAMTNAYRFVPAGELAIYTYSNIIFSTIIGFLVWSEIPDFLSLLGGSLIISAGLVNFYNGNREVNS